ncbi:outer membrane lipid asymmetry maintenance protein MlaD [Rariglobus hedericola]|uniref:Outer membrane lipid asymmetry maintenance protein MlaD n=1 Tax=Rariglobus hedericola TaxID=2597822 RepID=A0A556QRX4_9BACT|nr:outer membrane lipid asymmetry maintenance protein MlaD [Rariglobus hedericola]TSJ79397.1 outer membrane lipid asymmetry maintenance protein MlaD [Rariglobus hedericola]
MKQSRLELIVGVFVLAGLLAVAYLALRIGAGAMLGGDTYTLKARFTNAGGLNPGSNVLIAGVPVGRVDSIKLNPEDYSAVVELSVRKDVKLPTDSIASIKTSGLIGDKFLALSPGSDDEMLPSGAMISDTESTVDLESLISRFAFGNVSDKTKTAAEPAAETTPSTTTPPTTTTP